MSFPTIRNIEDIYDQHSQDFLDEQGFLFLYKDHYTTVDYVISKERTFETALMRELRGIKFCARTGNIIARPLHKFFNIGEPRAAIKNENLPYAEFFEKLDGSMVHLTHVGSGELHTRKGASEQALMAQEFVAGKNNYQDLFNWCETNMYTPIFEYVSPRNRIVIKYTYDDLILLAVRNMITGEYLDYKKIAQGFLIPYVHKVDVQGINIKEFIENKTDYEGVVVRYGDQFAKMKTPDYLIKHRAVDQLKFEKDVIVLCLDDLIDDIIPLLDEYLKDKLISYNNDLKRAFRNHFIHIRNTVIDAVLECETRKGMAEVIKQRIDKNFHGVAFKFLDKFTEENSDLILTNVLKDCIKQRCNSSTAIDERRNTILKGVPIW